MTAATHTFQLLLLTFSGWVSRHQQDVIEYLSRRTASSGSR